MLAKALEAEKPNRVHAIEITLKEPDWLRIEPKIVTIDENPEVNGKELDDEH